MRFLTLAALLLAAVTVHAQSPTAPPAAPAMSERNKQYLDAFLDFWEKRMAKVEGLKTDIVLTEAEGGPAKNKTVYAGEAALLKPNFAKMKLVDQAASSNSKKWRHFAADGEFLWEYDYGKKIARVQQLPKEGIRDNTAIAILFGMKAADAKKRFDLSIDVDDAERYSDFYLHIRILPKTKEDMQEFKKAELVLWKNNKDPKYADLWMLPARLWFQNTNGDMVTWEFQKMSTQAKLGKADFKAPSFPDKEWKSEWSKPPAPTVSRTVAPPK
jgi:TIGR03009 family protein